MDVRRIDVIATEATRRAKNGSDLVDAIRETTGLETRILTGEEEATYTAYGVISGFFQPKGLVGDIGGGSLEIAEVIGDGLGERLTSMPLGALPVKAMMAESVNGRQRTDRHDPSGKSAAASDRACALCDRRWLAGAGAGSYRDEREADQRRARLRDRRDRGAGAGQEDRTDVARRGRGAA